MAKAKQKPGKPRRRDPLLRQAKLEARVQYGPELDALNELLRESRDTLRRSVSAETGAARVAQQALQEARPELQRVYTRALADYEGGRTLLAQDLDRLGAVADPYRAISSREYEGAKRRLIESSTRAIQDLEKRKAEAASGAQYAIRQRAAEYRQDVQKIGRQRQQVQARKGQFTVAAYEKLKAAQAEQEMDLAKFNLDIAKEERQARQDRFSRKAEKERLRQGRVRLQQGQQRIDRQGESGSKPKWTAKDIRTAREKWRKGLSLVGEIKPKRSEGNATVAFLSSKDIPEPIARGVVQMHLFGGVRPQQRKLLERQYGIKPKVYSRRRAGRRAAEFIDRLIPG